MSFRQIATQAGERIHQIRVNRQGCHGPMQVVPHHVDITDRPEHGAQPEQVIAQMLCLRTLKRQSERRRAAAQTARGHPHPVDRARAVEASSRLARLQHIDLGAQVGRHRLTGAAQVRRRGSAYLPQSTSGATPPLGLHRGRCRWALALCYPSVASLMLPASNGGAMAAVTAST